MEDYNFMDHLRVLLNLKKKIHALSESMKPKEYMLYSDKSGQSYLLIDGGDHTKKYQFASPANITSAITADPAGNTSNDWIYAPTVKPTVKRRKVKKKSFVELQDNPSIKVLDQGTCCVLEDRSDFKDFDFQGEALNGRYVLRYVEFQDKTKKWIWWKPKKQ